MMFPGECVIMDCCPQRRFDRQDFKEHIGGKPHREEVRSLEQRYIRELSELRVEAKDVEQRKQKTRGEARMQGSIKYCPVCDLRYAGDVASHENEETHEVSCTSSMLVVRMSGCLLYLKG